ncbi:MAG: SLBB domain-containing protein [Longimicrobiales bacterium]
MRRFPRALTAALLGTAVFLAAAAAGQAQVVPPERAEEALRNLSREEIQRRIRASGLSEAQIRDRLRQAGYDPGLADRYFEDPGAEGLAETSPQDAEFLQVLRTLGVLLESSDSLRLAVDTVAIRDSLDAVRQDEEEEPRVFGIDVFRRPTSQFSSDPVGPVGPDYPMGPGDEVILVLTGDVEAAYRLGVTRDGVLVVPDVGQIAVNGLTLGQLEDVLYNRLGQVYSGIRRGPDATARFDVSLGRLRTNQVYVVGDVVQPGAYRISSVGTLLEGLYAAGGPTEHGSFRGISVRRNGVLVGTYDLYDYLTAGRTEALPRLQNGDVVFVPAVGSQVTVAGEVRREAIYELLDGDGLPEVVAYAGGLLPTARTDVVRIDRIIPRAERVQGRDRLILDVDYDAIAEARDTFSVRPGDGIEVFPVLDARRGWVDVKGAVYRPGLYELRDASTVADVIDRAGGALPDVVEPVVHVSSLNVTDGTRTLTRVPLGVTRSVPLREFDEITLFGRDSLLAPDSVGVFGLVQKPGRYPLSLGASAEDMILLAGGLSFGGDPRRAEITRLVATATDGVSVSTSIEVGLSNEVPVPGPTPRDSLPVLPATVPMSVDVPLQPEDEIYVRQIPQYRRPRRVEVAGEVITPGTYVLERMDERVSSLIERSGGLTGRAFNQGFRLIRDGITVGVDLNQALESPGTPADPVLIDGDRLVVPIYDATVLVTGAVAFETRVVYRSGLGLDDVLSEAGGVTAEADKGRISVEYANGSRRTVRRILGINVSEPDIRPGSSVFVPEAQERGSFDFSGALSQVLAVASTLATLIIATR